VSESSPSRLVQPRTLESHAPTSSSASIKPASRSDFFGSMKAASTASSNISIEGASIKTASSQAYISYQGRKHPRSHNRSRTARPSTHAQPRTGTQGGRAWGRGRKAQILLYTERGRGRVRLTPPICTQYPNFITAIKNPCF